MFRAAFLALPLVTLPLAADWPDPVAHHVMPYHTSGFTLGPMLGKPNADSVRVWVQSEEPVDFRVLYDTALPLDAKRSPSVAGKTSADAWNTGTVDLTGLEPNTRYYYGVVGPTGLVDTRMEFHEPWPSFRTLPDATSFADDQNNPDGLFDLCFSIGCCMRQKSPVDAEKFGIYANPPSYQTLFDRHRDEVAFHIVNGDFTYEEVLDGTPGGYAANYELYMRRGRNQSKFLRYVPLLTMYNDHEVNSNLDGAGEVGLGNGDYLKRDPALAVWQHFAGWANDRAPMNGQLYFGRASARRGSNVLADPSADFGSLDLGTVSTLHVGPYIQGDGQSVADRGGKNAGVYDVVEVLDEHRLRVEPAFRTDGPAPYSIGTHHYFDKRISNCHFFFIDTRGERAKWKGQKHAHDPDRFVLGDTQRQWLLDGVRNTDADFVFIISPDPWTIYHSAYHVAPERGTGSKGDGFCGYVHEREQILPVLDALPKPVLIFTGDVHNSFSVQITDNVWELTIGPMNSAGHPIGTAGLPPFGGWFDSEGRPVKVKWVAGFPDNVHYSRQRNTYYGIVQVNNIMKAAKPKGVGYQFVSYDEPTVVVRFHDGYTGRLVYAESISTVDAKPFEGTAPKHSRWPAVPAIAP